jgi:hypothetical protein
VSPKERTLQLIALLLAQNPSHMLQMRCQRGARVLCQFGFAPSEVDATYIFDETMASLEVLRAMSNPGRLNVSLNRSHE